MRYVSIADIFRECVQNVSEKLIKQLRQEDSQFTGVHFRHGHFYEVQEDLKQLQDGNSTRYQKWPSVILFRDFTEERGLLDVYSRPRVTLVIAVANDNPNMTSDEREEKKFKRILYPIYFELLNQLHANQNTLTLDPTLIEHSAIDHYYYGSNRGLPETNAGFNIFNEWTDSIEIRDLEINIKPLNC